MPPNCQFEIDDAEDEWVWRHKFDYVHGRYIVPFLNNLPKLMDNIYDNLKPGGYVEFLEAAMLFQAVDNTLDGKPMKIWNNLMIEGELDYTIGFNSTGSHAREAEQPSRSFADS